MANPQPYQVGYEYDLGNGTKGYWGGKSFMSAEDYLAQKQQRATQFTQMRRNLSHLDAATPLTEGFGATGFLGGLESGEGQPGWSPLQGIGGTPGYNLNSKLEVPRSNAMLQNMLKLKNASQTGSTGMGSQSDTEGKRLQRTDSNLDVRQGKKQLQDEIQYARQAAIENTPGIHPSNPIDLATMSVHDIPEGAFFRGPDGNVYTQKKGAGAPGTQRPGPPPVDPRTAANNAMRAKSGRPVLLGVEPPGGD